MYKQLKVYKGYFLTDESELIADLETTFNLLKTSTDEEVIRLRDSLDKVK